MNEILKSLGNAKDKARKHTYRCLCPGCQNKSINSHLVQQHPFDDTTYDTILELIYRMKNWCAAPSLFTDTEFAEEHYCRRLKIVMLDGGC